MAKNSSKADGNRGEDIAARFLSRSGYSILERNFRQGPGEIDIIAQKKGIIYFVEVKARHSSKFATPADSVTPNKRGHIAKAASLWFAKHGESDSGFIVAEVDLNNEAVYLIEDFLL